MGTKKLNQGRMMTENNLLTQILPILTIALCIGFIVIVKVISNMRSTAVGKYNPANSLKIIAAEKPNDEIPERAESHRPALVMRAKGAMKCTLKEISLSGAFLACPLPRPMGEMFTLKMWMENLNPLELNAEVIWNNGNVPASDIVTRGMKVRFLQMADKDRLFISELINPP